jgi:hypothetical protein
MSDLASKMRAALPQTCRACLPLGLDAAVEVAEAAVAAAVQAEQQRAIRLVRSTYYEVSDNAPISELRRRIVAALEADQ